MAGGTQAMKLIIQIPCWNEAETIGDTIRSLPGRIAGMDVVEIIVIDDGSTDNTVAVAREAGIDGVVSLPRHLGLAAAFSAGIKEAIIRDADVLVNTDADLQYPSDYISGIVAPIAAGDADIVVGDRLSHRPAPFSPVKMLFEKLGTWVVHVFSGAPIKDAASGFRAFGREAIRAMVIHGKYSYTLESLMLSGMMQFRLRNVTIPINPPRRKSRLVRSIPAYISHSAITIIRAYLMYHPLMFFVRIGMIFLAAGFVLGVRFLVYYFTGAGGGHIQSLILLAILVFMGVQCVILGLLADVVAANRRLLEQQRLRDLTGN